eukprot:TRINITY_DN950_c0_g1_i1.p1 TRINITY_DN950_c0_g1~~TRINITY_DN950_c0_g1_i1.p1  ORF type:complete len:763 (-),score=180.61 TRINITY_DN950_c0_g1_i1:955-3243(-)
MVMDPSLGELAAAMSAGIRFDEFFLDPDGFKEDDPLPFLDQSGLDLPFVPPVPSPNCNSDPAPCLGVNLDESSLKDFDIFSDISLNYISKMLLEQEDHEAQSSLYQENPALLYQEGSALQAAEKPLYEILGEEYPPLVDQLPFHDVESPDDFVNRRGYSNYSSGGSSSSSGDGGCVCNGGRYSSSQNMLPSSNYTQISSSSNCTGNVIDGLLESPTNTVNTVEVSEFYDENHPVWQFQKGVEEASKFLPNHVNLITDLDDHVFSPRELKEESHGVEVTVEKKDQRDHSGSGSRGRKNPHPDDFELEGGRSNKQTAVFHEETVRSEMFDMVLLCGEGKCGSALADLQEALQNQVSKNSQNEQSKGSNGGGRSRGKKQGKREVVDLRNLLIQCAQAVAANDWRSGSELLKQIRQHSSPSGDGSQRLAYYFAEGLEARLAGTGSQIYIERTLKRRTAADILKAYYLFLAACPFKRVSYFFANQTILDTVENATRLHIVDFGINYGFQWPCLLQRLGGRSGGPPKVRMTGIDLPQSGFRPAERVEETGRRLADYAQTFNVPFEYVSIACSKWETIQVEDLKIEKDEVLVVNCSYQLHRLADETVTLESPRDLVLKTINKMNPDVFIHGIVNGSYNSPFFITRFREALFHWSAVFDMVETNVPREQPERTLIERDLFGGEAMNIIACEGTERVERPETYKQWKVRTMRAGFLQLPLNQEIIKKARDKVRSSYHKDFVIDENSQWLLQGWKGRIVYALSTWKPGRASA